MRRTTTFAIVLSSLVLLTATPASLAQAEEPGSNGVVYMVHGHFEPAVTEDVPPPPIQEAFATTQNDGEISLYVIPYSVDTEAPVDVEDAEVTLFGPLPGQSVVIDPREGTSSDDRCVDETTIEGHEGAVSDCLVATTSAESVSGWGAVEIELTGTFDGEPLVERYSSPAHVAIHTTMEDGEPGFGTADQLSALSTPFVVEDLVDPA